MSGEAHRGVSPFWTRCRGCGNSVCIGFERWMNRGCGNSVCIGFERWMKHTSRGSGPTVVFLTGSKVGLGTPWRRIRDLFGPALGLESCWGFAVSHASSTPCLIPIIRLKNFTKHCSLPTGLVLDVLVPAPRPSTVEPKETLSKLSRGRWHGR